MSDLMKYVGEVVDTALSAERSTADIHAGARLVGWQCGFEPHVVAVIDAYDGRCEIEEDEAVEIATEWLVERKWFRDCDNPPDPDYVELVTEDDLEEK